MYIGVFDYYMGAFQLHLPLVLIFLATSVGVLTTLYALHYLNKYEPTKQVVLFTVLSAAITTWTVFALLQLTATSYDRSYWAYKLLHFGSFTTAPAVLFYGFSMGDAHRWVNWKTVSVVVLWLVPVFALLFTDPVPVLFEDPHTVSVGAFSVIEHGNSLIYVSYLSAFYVIATIGLSYIVYQTWTDSSLSRGQTVILVPAIFAPMLLSVAQTFSLLPFETPGTILTPTSFSVGMAGVGYAAFRYETFDTKALARSRTIENMSDGYMLIDTTGEIIDANQSARSLLAVESPLTGTQIRDLFAPVDEQLLNEPEIVSSFETTVSTEDETRTLEISPSNFATKTGHVIGTLFVIREITERKAYQQEVEQQRDDLNTLNQVLRHDIRNDLQLVTTYAELLADECEMIDDQTEADVQQYIETIQERTAHSVELTTTAREMADTMLTDDEGLRAVTLRSTLESELEEVRAAFPEAVVTTESTIPATEVRANDMLGSVFQNLLKNAIQHNDSEVPEVAVSVTESESAVVIRVADNGPGIPDDQKETVFGKGEKGLDSQGSGIGLYLVQTLVTTYGGSIWIEDNDPEGSVFAVELQNVS
jgi:PAS domain S-box-containing protein